MESPAPASIKISREDAGRAVDALLKWMREQAKQRKAQLLEHDDLLNLVLTLKRIPPSGRTNPYLIPLPHPLFDPATTSICIFIDDRPSSRVTQDAVRAATKSASLPIDKVITLSDLRSDYRPFEARRKLCGSHDLFFADRKILHLLPRFIGKHFFKSKKTPLPINFSRAGWPEQIRHCCRSTFLYLRTGTCSGVKVGRVSQGRDEIVDNLMAAVQGAVELVPKKWDNIRSVHLKSVESLALPIYQAVPEIGLKIEGLKPAKPARVKGADGKAKKKLPAGSKKAGSKKRKGRIHEVDFMDTSLHHGSEDDNDGTADDELAEKKIAGSEEEKEIADPGAGKKGNKKKKKKQKVDSEVTEKKEKKLKRNAGKEEVSNMPELGKRKKAKKGVDKDGKVQDIENGDGKPDDVVEKENGGEEPLKKRNAGKEEVSNTPELGKSKKAKDDKVHDIENGDGKPDDTIEKKNGGGKGPLKKRNAGKEEVSNTPELGKRKKAKKGMDNDDKVHDIENADGKPDDDVEKENGGQEPRETRARKKKDKAINGDQADGMKEKQKITRANKSEGKAAKKTRKN